MNQCPHAYPHKLILEKHYIPLVHTGCRTCWASTKLLYPNGECNRFLRHSSHQSEAPHRPSFQRFMRHIISRHRQQGHIKCPCSSTGGGTHHRSRPASPAWGGATESRSGRRALLVVIVIILVVVIMVCAVKNDGDGQKYWGKYAVHASNGLHKLPLIADRNAWLAQVGVHSSCFI